MANATTKTKPLAKREAVKTATDILRTMHDSAQQILDASEQIILNAEDDRYIPDQGELMILNNAGYDTSTPMSRSGVFGRGARVRELKQQAGSGFEYAAARDAVTAAQAAEAEQVPALEKVIADAKARIGELATAVEDATARLKPMDDARTGNNGLRSQVMLPPWVWKSYEGSVAAVGDDLRKQIGKLKSRKDRIERIIFANSDSITDQEALVTYGQAKGYDLRIENRGTREQYLRTPDAWEAHVDELQAERVEILDELETLNDRLAQVCRESESIRNFYIDQLGEVPAAVSVRVEASVETE